MDKQTARAVGTALAVYTYVNAPFGWGFKDVFTLADKYAEYIYEGHWPKEATDQLGKQEGKAEERG